MKTSDLNENTIRRLIDSFYGKVQADHDLAPVFIAAIGESDEAWGPHLGTMVDFWSSVMLTSGRYHGNPLRRHMDLPPFPEGLFQRWLELFAATAQEIHTDDIAALYIDKSRRIAESLKLGLYYRPKA